MRRLIKILSMMIVVLALSADCYSQLVWRETAKDINVPSITDPAKTDGIEIFTTDGAVIIRTNKKIQVRIFTILGQLVSQAVINPGTSELRLGSRGIYIIKIGNITQKIAL